MRPISAGLALVSGLSCAPSREPPPPAPQLAPKAPVDQPLFAIDTAGADRLFKTIQPCILRAQGTYVEAKHRYVVGLPPDQSFFVTVRLRDSLSRTEQVFVVVDSIKNDTASGRIASTLGIVHGFYKGQPLVFPETQVLDWTISHPDGTEEGNYVGKFVDELQAGGHPTC